MAQKKAFLYRDEPGLLRAERHTPTKLHTAVQLRELPEQGGDQRALASAHRADLTEHASSDQLFRCVCPEPVLANYRFLCKKWHRK